MKKSELKELIKESVREELDEGISMPWVKKFSDAYQRFSKLAYKEADKINISKSGYNIIDKRLDVIANAFEDIVDAIDKG
jgi:hypothetical protein